MSPDHVKSTPRDFDRFHKTNPQVYQWLLSRAIQLKNIGCKQYGINSLIQVFRWHTMIETRDPEFKINNNYAPFYARLLMQNEPRLEGFFRVRASMADPGSPPNDL